MKNYFVTCCILFTKILFQNCENCLCKMLMFINDVHKYFQGEMNVWTFHEHFVNIIIHVSTRVPRMFIPIPPERVRATESQEVPFWFKFRYIPKESGQFCLFFKPKRNEVSPVGIRNSAGIHSITLHQPYSASIKCSDGSNTSLKHTSDYRTTV